MTVSIKRRAGGPPIPEPELASRGWTRLFLRLPPRYTAILLALRKPGEKPGLAVRRLIDEAASRISETDDGRL